MSDSKQKPARLRRALVRGGLVVVYVALVALVFVVGKGHTILVDNKDLEAEGLTAFGVVTVGVDGQETQELYPGDRVLFKVKGQKHRITFEVDGQEGKVTKALDLPQASDMVLVSLPKLAKGLEPTWEPFTAKDAAPAAAGDSQNQDEAFTSPGGTPSTTEGPTPVPTNQ